MNKDERDAFAWLDQLPGPLGTLLLLIVCTAAVAVLAAALYFGTRGLG
jgi:hypothetical protein